VQDDLYAVGVQGLDLVKNENDATVIRRVGNIEGNYVQKHTGGVGVIHSKPVAMTPDGATATGH
jgi:hypothetical protein